MNRRFGAGLILAAVAGVLTLATLGAAFGGDWQLEQRFDIMPDLRPVPPTTTPEGETGGSIPDDLDQVDMRWVVAMGNFLLVAVGLVGLYGLWRLAKPLLKSAIAAWRARKGRFRNLETPWTEVEPEPVVEPSLPALQRGVSEARSQIRNAAVPNDGIVAAWLELEQVAEASGVARRPAQTPSEFTAAVFTVIETDRYAAKDLRLLYERVRFSNYPATRQDLDRADQLLERIATGWAMKESVEAVGSG